MRVNEASGLGGPTFLPIAFGAFEVDGYGVAPRGERTTCTRGGSRAFRSRERDGRLLDVIGYGEEKDKSTPLELVPRIGCPCPAA